MKHHFKQISNKVTVVLTFILGLYLCKVYTDIHGLDYTVNMAEETGGGDREGPSPPDPINSISWVGPGRDPIYNTMGPFYFAWTVFQQLQ